MPLLAWLALLLMCTACAPSATTYSHFCDLPSEGWYASTPLYFTPQYDDSVATCVVMVAVRHTAEYEHSNLQLIVDLVGDSTQVTRVPVSFDVADEYGNWMGSGFGSLYQLSRRVAEVTPSQAKSVVVWHVMPDSIKNLTNVGIIVTPQ